MFGFAGGLDSMVHDALFQESCLGVAVIDREHHVVATNAEMDRINGFKHPGKPVNPAERMPEIIDDINDHVEAVFMVGEPVLNVPVDGPGAGPDRRSYLCDYLPSSRNGPVEYVIAVVRPARTSSTGRKPMADDGDVRDAPLP